ncbi:MAG: hypothetical protein IPM34_02040 [Saprospiraceae bacterium]|nr:hypothetical protein [Saprospiraceae bacterium]
MVEITTVNSHFSITLKGFYKFFAFKSEINILKRNIVNVYQSDKELSGWIGWRSLGTSIPFFFNVGTFCKNGKKNFWYVFDKSKAIIIELENEDYDKLIIEVENPQEAIKFLLDK